MNKNISFFDLFCNIFSNANNLLISFQDDFHHFLSFHSLDLSFWFGLFSLDCPVENCVAVEERYGTSQLKQEKRKKRMNKKQQVEELCLLDLCQNIHCYINHKYGCTQDKNEKEEKKDEQKEKRERKKIQKRKVPQFNKLCTKVEKEENAQFGFGKQFTYWNHQKQ